MSDRLPLAAQRLYALLRRTIADVLPNEDNGNSLFIHYEDGTVVDLTVKVVCYGGKDTVH